MASNRQAVFVNNIELCKKCIDTNGKLKFRRSNPESRRLGNWLRRQFKRRDVPTDEMALLDELRPYLETQERKNSEQWQSLFEELVNYKEEYHTLIISKKDREHKSLYNWCFRQRKLEKEGCLSSERKEALIGIGFRFGKPRHTLAHDDRFTPKQKKKWEKRYQELVDFQNKFGHCRVTLDDAIRPGLAYWVHQQRVTFSSGLMDSKREEKLKAIGFSFSLK